MTRRVVSDKNLPVRPPHWTTATAFLLLDRFAAPGWAWGVVGTIFALVWAIWIADLVMRKPIELFKDMK